MKLIFDIAKFLLKAVVAIFILMSVLWAGTGIAKLVVSKTSEERMTLDQARETFETHAEERNSAKNRAEQAAHTLQRAKDALEAQRETLQTRIDDAANIMKENLDALKNNSVSQFIGNIDDWESTTRTRNDLFVKMCDSVSGWDKSTCGQVLKDAKVHPDNARNRYMEDAEWQDAVKESLSNACETWSDKWDKIQLLNLGSYACGSNKKLVENVAYKPIVAFLKGHAAYQRAQRTRHADEASLNQLEDDVRQEQDAYDHAIFAYNAARDAYDDAKHQYDAFRNDPWNTVRHWANVYWKKTAPFFWMAFGVWLSSYLMRPIIYLFVAPFVERRKPVRLRNREDEDPQILRSSATEAESITPAQRARVRVSADQRMQLVHLQHNETLRVRPEYVKTSKDGKAEIIYGGRKHAFTSYAAGLVTLTCFEGAKRPPDRPVTIAGTGEGHTNAYILRLDLENHPGFVVRPRHVVGIQDAGDLTVRARWRFRLMSLLRWQIRYWVFEGTGSLYFVGYGGAFPHTVPSTIPSDDGQSLVESSHEDTHANDHASVVEQPSKTVDRGSVERLNDALVMGWDTRLDIGIARNENWLHVAFLKRDAMFESSFIGSGIYLTTNSVERKASDPAGRFLEAILNVIGKLAGI